MIGVIGETLPLAIGIAASPLPIIAVILMLLSSSARRTSIGFLVGWLGGLVVAVVIFQVLAGLLPASGTASPRPVAGLVKVVLGLGLLALAVRQWRSRPAPGEQADLPAWMSTIDKLDPVKAAGLAFVFAAANPKNLILAATSGIQIGQLGAVAEQLVATLVFVLVAGSTVAVPVVAFLVAADRLAGPLESLREWLVHYNATIMFVVLLLLGVSTVGKGLADF